MRQLPCRARARPRSRGPRPDPARLPRPRSDRHPLGRGPARGRRGPGRPGRLADAPVDRVAGGDAGDDRDRRGVDRLPPALPAARVPARDRTRRALGTDRLPPHPRARLRRGADGADARAPVGPARGDAGRAARRRRDGGRVPGRRRHRSGAPPRARPARRRPRRHRGADLHIRHHRPPQGGDDHAPGAADRSRGRERALADEPAAAAPHDAGQPHRRSGDGRRLRALHRRHPGVPGPLRRGRPAPPAGGGAHRARARLAGAVPHDGQPPRSGDPGSLAAQVHHLGRGADGGAPGGPAALASGRAAHELRDDRAGPLRHLQRAGRGPRHALPDHRQAPSGLRDPGRRRFGRHRGAGRAGGDPGPRRLAPGRLLPRPRRRPPTRTPPTAGSAPGTW